MQWAQDSLRRRHCKPLYRRMIPVVQKVRRTAAVAGYNLGQNKMEHQTPMVPPWPQIKDEASQKLKRAILILGGGEEGYKFSIYFV